jgi:hypothetical protein
LPSSRIRNWQIVHKCTWSTRVSRGGRPRGGLDFGIISAIPCGWGILYQQSFD